MMNFLPTLQIPSDGPGRFKFIKTISSIVVEQSPHITSGHSKPHSFLASFNDREKMNSGIINETFIAYKETFVNDMYMQKLL